MEKKIKQVLITYEILYEDESELDVVGTTYAKTIERAIEKLTFLINTPNDFNNKGYELPTNK